MALLIVFLLFSAFPSLIFSIDIPIILPTKNVTVTGFTKLQLPVASTGSLAFDLLNEGPYTGTTDGRILKYISLIKSFQNFAYTSVNRTNAFCDGTTDIDKSPICGFPTGLGYNYISQKLYACDVAIGLTDVGPFGGLATTLVPTKNGVPYKLLLGLDVSTDGTVYFTDASTRYGPKEVNQSILTGDATGRLLKYDPITKNVTILLSKLAGAVGVASNFDASFLLVSEFTGRRIQKYWLKGEKAGTSEIFLTFPGNPNKIKRNQDGDFWIALNIPTNNSGVAPQGVKVSPCGQILATVDLSKEYNDNRRITVVQEQTGKLYVAGLNITFVGQYNIVKV
ncbi:hypothetical protein ACH5RR_025042 [Cinchona calisaya]|uniref:Strictosidine synthase conserved region domain-containing protein n=1 Tax=Cinchona calisaya TaxID=153742 RepID=A0ABD2Z1V9_9GENT